ncbi:MAG: T9SS type A sorting domain-containing protein [Saprospiraceae bacterium]|nr:T9SS type A sorting domain-containing protein [Saprospiraceae bacterium]
MKPFLLFAILISIVALGTSHAQAPEGFEVKLLAERLDPVTMIETPDGRILVAEKKGTIRIIKDGSLSETVFLTLPVDNFNERGLSGLVLHPQYEENNFLYVYYTVANKLVNRVSRFTANGDHALPQSEKILFETDSLLGAIHNAGAMRFGNDGMLYISVGDMAQNERAKDLNYTNGKILRLEQDGSIPSSNPFYDVTEGYSRAIWAYGLRNSFSMAVNPLSGMIVAGDVGLESWEEINEILPGKNYGWDILEGRRGAEIIEGDYQDPLHVFKNEIGTACALTGLAFYTPKVYSFPPQYHDKLLYAELCSGEIRVLDPSSGVVSEVFMRGVKDLISLLVGRDGALYYIERNSRRTGTVSDNSRTDMGRVWSVSYEGSGRPYISIQPTSQRVVVGENARFSVRASGKNPLNFQWFRNGSAVAGANADTLILTDLQLVNHGDSLYCTVSNGIGSLTSSKVALLVAKNKRPEVEITYPPAGYRYQAGQKLSFEGIGHDAEDGNLSGDKLTWRIDFHHEQHTHPFLAGELGASGQVEIPISGETSTDVWYRIYLFAEDEAGFANHTYRDIFPEIVTFAVTSEPSNLEINVDGKVRRTPFEVQSVQGVIHTVSAPILQHDEDKIFGFQSWSPRAPEATFAFQADREGIDYHGTFRERYIGKGVGLLGSYYDDQSFESGGPPVFTRVDSVIFFHWFENAPGEGVPDEHFTVQWTGFLEVPFSDEYTFYLEADDASRLIIDSITVIDQWAPGMTTAALGGRSIYLEEDILYPIEVSFRERYGWANCAFRWSSSFIEKSLVWSSQFFPDSLLYDGNETHIVVAPNPTGDEITFRIRSLEKSTSVEIYDVTGRMVASFPGLRTIGRDTYVSRSIAHFSPGMYYCKVLTCPSCPLIEFVKR